MKIFADDGQRANFAFTPGSESARSSSTGKPSRASAIDGAISSASVNLPEPYFSVRERQPRDRPGHADGKSRSRDFCGSASPCSSRKMSRVVAGGAVSR